MLRHASIYRVTRSCKINQRSSVCQQKATMKKNICLPSKEKSAFSQLQRIENKLYHQTWSCAKLQAARRKLWCEKSFDGKRSTDETGLNEKKSNEVPSACREGICAALSPAWSQSCLHESPAASSVPPGTVPLSPRGHPRSAPRGPARRQPADGEGTAGTWSPATSLCRARRDGFREQMDSRSRAGQKGKCPRSPHHPAPSPVGRGRFSAPVPTAGMPCVYCPAPGSGPSDQKLEGLWKKSPQKKLEQLRKKIQEQKQKQQAANQAQECQAAAQAAGGLPQKRPLTRKVCAAVSAPPAPVCRDQRGRSSAQRIQTQSQRQPSPKSSAPERTAASKDTKLPGPSAWREGQKLARQLLGPPPAFPKQRSTAEEQTTGNALEPERGFVAMPAMENSSRENGNEPVGKSPEFKSCTVPPHRPVEGSSSAPTEDTKPVLRNLHLQSQYHDEHRRSRLPEDTVKAEVEVLQQYPGILSPSPEPQTTTPSAFIEDKIRASLIKAGAKPGSSEKCSRGKSTPPQRWKGSSSPLRKGSGKENLKYPSKRRVNIRKPHPYSPEVVQEFIYRKNEERKKKKLEEKKSLMKAIEMRNKRLQEVYRKQREAVGKKTLSDQAHSLVGETAAATQSPRCALKQEQTSGGILARSFMAWADKTSHTLLNKDHRDRNQLLKTGQSPKNRETLPSAAPLGSECWFFSPLKREDLRDCSPPALPIPPLSFSLLQKDAKLNSKDSISGLSPYRSKWDRVKAIHNLSKELAEKIEMSTKRLGATSRVKGLADQIPAETTWDLFNKSSVTEPDTSKDEQDRTMTLQMLLGDPEPAELRVSSDRAFHGLGRIGLVGTEGATDQASQNKIPTSLSGGSAGGKELPWNTHSIKPRHLSTGEDMSSTLKGFPVNKGSEVDMSLLHEKPITSPAFPSHGFLARSLQREPAAQRNHRWPETILEVQPREGIARWCPPESLRTPDSLRAQPSAAPTSVSRTRDGFKQDFASAGAGDPSCAELEEKHRSHLDNLRQTSLLLAHRLKAHQLQQKQQLTVLSEKAKREVQESQRFLSDLLQDNLKLCSSSKGSYSSVPKLDHAEQTWTGSQSEGDNASGSNEEMHSLKLSELNMERDHSPVDPKIVEQRKSPGGRDSYCSTLQEGSLPAEDGELLHVHQALNLSSPLGNAPHGEPGAADGSAESSDQASLDSQWSEVGRHYGSSSTFCRFSLAMAEQCLRGEELRARHQAALLKLRRKALRAKARAELAWLGHQKRCLESLQDSKGASAVAEKQHKILTELEQEQVEIQHLQNLYRAAHQERKLLLKQQREILMMQHSTAQLQEELHNLTGKKKLTRSPATEEANKPKTRQISSSTFDSLAESTACSERPDMTGDKKSCVQLKNKESKKYDSFSTENKKTPVQHQKWAEESPSLERFLVVQGPDVSGTVTRKVCDATSQTTGLVFMIKDCKNTELNVQDHILLHLEHANSAGTDEAIATSITTDGRKCMILESVLKEKAFISNPKIEPKDNEDINPCYSKFTAKSLGMLSTLCNLCQVQSANIPQETGGDAPSLVEDQGSDSLTVEKVHGEQRSHRTPREEQDSCPFQSLQTQTQKKDPSFDTEDKERRSAVISNEATVVKAQLRKENSLQEQQRVSTDSERKAEVVHMDEKAPSEILSSEAVPVKEIEVSFPCEIHRVDDNPCLKPLNHNSHEASDEELTLKVFCKGLASAESSSKSNDFSPRCESAKSDSSLSEFQKVSAVWIDISESSTSDSELEVKNGKDTDVSIPEEFIYDNNDAFPNTSKEMPIAASIGKETLHSDKRNEHEAPKEDNSTKISSLSQNSQKCPGEASDQGCPDHLLSFLPTDKANTFKTKPLDAFQFKKTAKGMDKPNLEASESSKDAAVSSLGSDSICLFKISEQQKPTSTTSRVKKDGGINSLLMDHSRERKQLLLMDSLKHLDLATDQFSSTVSLPPEKGITDGKLVAYLSSRNAAAQNNHAQLLNERLASRELDKIVSLPTSVQGISEEVHTETYSFESLQRVAPGNQNHSKTERQDPKELGKGFSSTSSKKQLFQAENCSSKGEDDTIFISDEGLPPADEDTLSEILSPVDEVLSYGSADLPSSNKKDLSFPSEDLPPPPLGVNAMKNDDSSFSMDDFPTPPEQMTVSETRQCMDEDTSLRTDALSPLLDNVGPEEFPLLSQEPTDVFSVQDVNVSEQSLVKEDKSSFAQELSEYRGGEHETPLQYLECLPVSNPTSSGQASKNPDSTLKQCETYLTLPKAEEDGDDPLSSFEIGDRVLVKQTQPGTLMFKGRTCFDCGHWAGVALDKAEGDHAGTYKGVKYFECAQHCGIFVRPNEISHLLEDNNSGPNNTGDEDSDSSYDDESFKRDCKYPEADEQGTGVTEQNTKDTKSAGGSEMPENQSRLHVALLSGKGQKFTHSDQCKCNEFLCQNNLMCLESDEEKTEVTQIKQGMLADVLLKKNKASSRDGVNTSKNICCLLEDQKRNILADDITGELNKKLLFDTLIAFSETDQHKHKSAFEKDMMNYGKGLTEEDNLKQFLIKENPVASLSEQSAKVSDVSLCDFNMLSIHGCHTVAERIVTKFVDDAVKEYKKIKRKHGAKVDKIFHSSSETSPTTLPFLIKILDAGVFGSSEDFDQPNSDEHTLERQTQKQYLYKLDRWHSAPWKKTVEVPLVVPHYSSYVKKLSASAVEELWTPENIYSNFKRISVPKHFECYDFPGNGLETESKRMYNQVIFDLTREVLCTEYQVTANPNRLPWLKENLGSRCSRSHCRRADVNEVKTFVQGEVVKIMNLEKNDLEMKRKLLNMTKYGNCEKDRVDLILIQELRREESQWTYYDDDELTVKMRMTENIFDSLILDTIRVLNKIYLRKACEVFPNSGILIPDF